MVKRERRHQGLQHTQRLCWVWLLDKKSVVEATLKREEQRAREEATKVMERIMATGNEDNKVKGFTRLLPPI